MRARLAFAIVLTALCTAALLVAYANWREGKLMAEEHFDGFIVQVLKKPASQGLRGFEVVPGNVDYSYEIRVLNGSALTTAFTVWWSSHDFKEVKILEQTLPKPHLEVIFEGSYVVECEWGGWGDMPWATWKTRSR